MDKLIKLNLVEAIKNLKQPVLGICLGMQLLCTSSEESSTKCLNVIPLKVRALKTKLVCPHMG
jgi:glutamine amidotransferase